MASPIATDLGTVVTQIKAEIVNSGLFGTNTCFVSLNPDRLEFPASDQFCVLTPRPQLPNQGYVAGGGNDLLYFESKLWTTLWSRLGLDQTPRDDSWFLDSTYGLLPLVKSVVKLLQLYVVTDTSGNILTPEPMRLLSTDFLRRDYDGVGWGQARLKWSVNYQFSFV